jgi:uncharacterized membrane-anchored protein YjiN (DUF445 family)
VSEKSLKESLEQFVKEEFLSPGPTQDRLKATDSFDDFVNLMVSLGNEKKYSFTTEEVKAFFQNEIDKIKNQKQDKVDHEKADIEAIDNLSLEKKIEAKEKLQKRADKEKEQIDNDWANKVANWHHQTVVNAIAFLKNDDVLPLW